MTHTYKYELVDGHIIAIAGLLRLLIDTGAPSSVDDSSSLEFAGRMHRTQKEFMGISPESLSKSVGAPVNALVGADIINQYDTLIDPTTHTLEMSEDDLPLAGQCLVMDDFMGIPIIEAVVSNDKVRMFFDTGAKLSYLNPDRTSAFQSAGTEEDFYPGVGNFSTNAYDIPIMFGSEAIVLRVGNLPHLLQMTLMMASTDGIVGTAILRTHKILLAPRRKTIALQRING